MSESDNNSRQSAAEALSDELLEFCRSDSLSEDGICEIIERHGLTPNNNHPNISDHEFFRAVCLNERVTEGKNMFLSLPM